MIYITILLNYEIFRNDRFLINLLDVTDELGLSKVLKAKIKGRDDLGKDERVGRRVIYEFNKSYPVVMSTHEWIKMNLRSVFQSI